MKNVSNYEDPVAFPEPNSPYEPEQREVILYKVDKDETKNPSVIAGKTYKFHVEGTSNYLIIAPTNNSTNAWNTMANDGSNVFEMEVDIPADALRVPIAFSNSNQSFEMYYANITVINNFEPEIVLETENIKRIIADIPVFAPKEKLIGGEFYEVCAGNNPMNYLNLSFTDGKKWLTYAIEKNEKSFFQKVIQVPADAKKVYISFHEKAYWNNGRKCMSVVQSPEKCPVMVKNDEENIIYIQAPVIDSKLKVEAGKFSKILVGPLIHDYVSFNGSKKVDKEDVSIFWKAIENNKKEYSECEVYIPQTKGILYVVGRNAQNEWENNLVQLEIVPSKKPYKFTTTSDYESLRKYKTTKPDERIVDYMASIDAREVAKHNPDLVISMTVDKINQLKNDDYEKVKLIHDAVWYLVSYDSDSLAIGRDLPQDYKSVLGRGMSVCAGFAAVFSQFCKVAEIREIEISGYARGTGKFNESWKPTDDPTKSNHAWNMVKIEDYWYLIDSTWDSGHTRNEKRDDYYSNAYIFVEPEEFIHTHFPSYDSDFQLIEKPYTPQEFSELPYKTPRSYFNF